MRFKFRNPGFEHLHRHTDYSVLDGYATIEEYAKRSSQINQRFLCISDHGSMGAIPRQIAACEKYKLEPIFACFFRGQEIVTDKGVKEIQDVVVGDLVLTHKGRFKRVIRTFSRNYNGRCVEISLAGAHGKKITSTAEHPFLVADHSLNKREWLCGKDICFGRRRRGGGIHNWQSYLCFPKVKQHNSELYFEASVDCDFSRGYARREYVSRQPAEWPNIPSSMPLDEDISWLLGLFAAEGSFSTSKGILTGGMRLSLNSDEVEHAERAEKILLTRFGLSCGRSVDLVHHKMDVTFSCVPLAHFLSYHIGQNCRSKKVPLFVLESSMACKQAFAMGLLAGDGKDPKSCPNSQFTLKVASRDLAWGLKLLLASMDIWANVSEINDKGKIAWQVPLTLCASYRRSICDNDYVYKPISNIRAFDVENVEVYNFEVEEDNSYCTDVAVHNCELYINPYQPELGKQWKTMAEYKEQLPPDIAGKLRKSNHLLAIAYNQEGYKNLVNMSSWAWIHGSYYKPRINHDILKAHKDGLIFTSCCYNSEIGQAFDTGGDDAGYDMIQKYLDMVGRENFYLEIMLLDFSKQKPYNQFIIRAADRFGLPIILTNDCHYCLAEDSHMQRLMLMVQTGRTIKEIQDALAKEDMADMFELQDKNLYMKSELELNEKYEKDFSDTIPLEIFEQAKANTLLIAERAKGVTLDRSIKLPQLPDADAKLKEEIFKGFKKRRLPLTKQYSQRLEEEYNLICQKGFSSYFLIQKMMTDEARRKCKELLGYGDGSEAVGPGRGSAVGALSCYCLGITDVNPIEHDLLFSRFLSPARGGKTMKLRFSIDPINAQDILDDIPFQVPEETSAAERPIDIN